MSDDPIDLSIDEYLNWRREGRPLLLLDCREGWEYDLARLEDALLVPLGEISERLDEIPRGREVVVYCHHGVRSRHAAVILRGAGMKARSLAGGIDRWSLQVDPAVPRY